jgi:hypothetical protein
MYPRRIDPKISVIHVTGCYGHGQWLVGPEIGSREDAAHNALQSLSPHFCIRQRP